MEWPYVLEAGTAFLKFGIRLAFFFRPYNAYFIFGLLYVAIGVIYAFSFFSLSLSQNVLNLSELMTL